jgi:hypothetical protein
MSKLSRLNTYDRGFLSIPVICIFVFFTLPVLAENPDTTMSKIKDNFYLIKNGANKLDINPKHLAAIIYTERTLNYDWKDEFFDLLYVKLGQNGSLGFCQVKLKTALFIELQLHDSTSDFYPDKKYIGILEVSKKPSELIDKLLNDSTNILYAAAYLKIIMTRWGKDQVFLDDRPDILGTIYSLGLFGKDGSERKPHLDPQPNAFGKKVIESLSIFNNFDQ